MEIKKTAVLAVLPAWQQSEIHHVSRECVRLWVEHHAHMFYDDGTEALIELETD